MQSVGGAFRPANFVLLGAYTFTQIQTLDLGSGALPALVSAATALRLATIDGSPCRIESFGFGSTGLALRGRTAGGTRSAPTAIPDAVSIVRLITNGFDGTTWQDASGTFQFVADGLWSGTNRGTMLTITGTPNGSTANAEIARFYRGAFLVGATTLVGAELVRFTGGTAPGTPGGTDVLIGAGVISNGATTNSTSITTGANINAGGSAIAKNIIHAQGRGAGVTSTVTAAATQTLTATSTEVQTYTGSTAGQVIQFPAANLFGAGIAVLFTINNQSTQTVTPTRAGADTFQGGGTTDPVLAGASMDYKSDGVSKWLKC